MLAVIQELSRSIHKLARQTGGNVSILLAIAALPLLLAAGAAIDYIRVVHARTQIQAAADSAALAVALADTNNVDEQKLAGATYFKSNFHNSELGGVEPTITVDEDKVVVAVTFDYPMTLMGLAGIATMPVGGLAEVELSKDTKVEVVLVLDYSGSMIKNDKYIRMRDAATKMIGKLAAAKDSIAKFGIVPFSAMIRTSMSAAYVTQASAGPTWTGCTQDRQYPWNIGVATPNGTPESMWGFIDVWPVGNSENAAPKYDCAKYKTNKLDIMPLTADAAAVQARLAEMTPVGNTNIPLGAEFGWNLLDPDPPFSEAAPYDDEQTKKFLVLLTDGVQTSRQWGDKGNRSVDNGNDNLKTVCQGMAAKDITVFAIAFDIKAAAVTDLLKACAPGNYFESDESGAEISAVFNAITTRIKTSMLRLTR